MIGLFPLKQSTASQEVPLGPFLSDTDGKTAQTGLTIANTDIKLWKSGGTTESNKASGGATHILAGRYYAVLDATDTDTLGPLEINVHVATALPVKLRCVVMTANAYDSLVSGSDRLQVDTAEVAGTSQTARDLGANLDAAVSTRAPSATALSTAQWTNTRAANLDNLDAAVSSRMATFTYTTPPTVVQIRTEMDTNSTKLDATISSRAPSSTALSTAQWTNARATNLDNLNAQISTVATPAQVLTQVTAALNTYDPPTKAEMDAGFVPVSKTTETVAIKAVTDKLDTTLVIDGAVYQFTVNALELAPVGSGGGGSGATAAQVADAVWDEILNTHNDAGSAGAKLQAIAAGDPWGTALPGAYAAGSAGQILGSNLNATVGSRATQTSVDALGTNMNLLPAIKLKTDNLPTDPADASDIAASFTGVNTKLDMITGHVDTEITQIITDIATLLARLTAARAGYLDNLNGHVPQTGNAFPLVQNVQTRIPAALVGGKMDSNVSAMVNGIITAAVLAADAIAAIKSGLATPADIPTPTQIANAHLDLPDGIELDWTPREAIRVILGEAAGLLSGAQTDTNVFTNPAGTKNRITATVTEGGDRTAVVIDKS